MLESRSHSRHGDAAQLSRFIQDIRIALLTTLEKEGGFHDVAGALTAWQYGNHRPTSPGIHEVPASGTPAIAADSTVRATRSSFSR